ncbi:hypothetical protein [Flagellimonas zhangzhouensis]|uniref:Uncharacterized protein n=1 Tax=Flagellimonas zhangzhouensis TaxID=1073328 RepID=A0A1H2WQ08_9FLAO|nr:hypothetical protein [Allomuricauda zhangzhouensis]SDQ23585.1 hypothetical protein SAMN05216294_1004 [Allomuricauda zhangzhouensis]SDW82740.1 hypothetical protein SAMN04487892_2384 [Allomuricauda zhangzhouensis]
METKTITRKELYELVWTTPLTQLAKQYNISDNCLRKICIKHEIPLPRVGHWSKVKYGKKVTKTPLKKKEKKLDDINLSERKEKNDKKAHFNSKYSALKNEIVNDPSLPLSVPSKMYKPDILVQKAKSDLATSNFQPNHQYQDIIHTTKGNLNIEVSKKMVPRALRFMNALIKLLRKRGHDIEIDGYSTYAIVLDEKINIRCREKSKRVLVKKERWTNYEYHASDILMLKMEADYFLRKDWADNKNELLEEQLAKILTKLELTAKQLKKERIEREEWHKKFQEEQKIKQELQDRKDKELQSLKSLFKDMKRHEMTVRLRSYVQEFKNHKESNGELTEDLLLWLEWANEKIEWFDPMIEREVPLLEDVERNSLVETETKRSSLFYP